MLARLDPSEFVIPVGVGLSGAMLGLLAGADPKLAVGAAFGVVFLLLTLANLAAGVAAFTLVMFLELSPVAGGSALSLTKLAGAVLTISWLASFATRERFTNTFWVRHPNLTTLLVAFCIWTAASYFWAEDPSVVPGEVLRLWLNAFLFLVLYEAIREPRHIRMVLGAFVVGGTMAAAYGVLATPDASQFAYGNGAGGLGRLAGTVGDPNVLAATLTGGLMIALALAFSKGRSSAVRVGCLVAAALCVTGVFLTGSRGGLVALGGALLAAVLLAPRRRVLVFSIALLIAGTATAYYAYLAPEAARERLTVADGGTGRTDIWKIGWRMVEANPVQGVGVANFQVSSIHYLLAEPGTIEDDTYVVDRPAVAHNAYLSVLAELGVPGLIFFLGVVGASLTCAYRASREFGRRGDQGMELVAGAVAVALVAMLAADIFVSEQFNKQLWLLMALSPAMLSVARGRAAED